jgi:hypothetical protein
MWKLLKTEVEYFRWLYILGLLVVIIINTGLTLDGKWIEAQDDFPGLRVIWLGVGIVVLFFAILFNRKSGRLKNQMMLPLNHPQLAIVRMLAFIVFWTALISILILFYMLNFGNLPSQTWLTNLLSISGIIFLVNSIPLLYTDFYSTYFSTRDKFFIMIFWWILWIIYVLMNSIFMTYLDFISPEFFSDAREKLTDLYFTAEVTAINVILGFGFFFLSILTFKKRKLYLE